MTDLTRRDLLQGLIAIPATLALSPEAIDRASTHAAEALGATQSARTPAQAYVPKQFTPDEWRLVRMLVDYVIPKDARSGSATDAGVPEFMDFILGEYASNRQWMKEGLAWMNAESRIRFNKTFVSASDPQRRELLDAIAFPKKASETLKQGTEFFTRFRNMTASGFFSSRMGIEDLGYEGNRPVAEWKGTPPEVLRKLGL